MNNYLVHHGILGQKWGIRRYQKTDGTRTALGKKHERNLSKKVDNRTLKGQKDKIDTIKAVVKSVAKMAILSGLAIAGRQIVVGLLDLYGNNVIPDFVRPFVPPKGRGSTYNPHTASSAMLSNVVINRRKR